ncbi:ankyrin repeat domain-containing protein [Pseudonocardia sp. GCM10023141]|uniref:ankyrin repeat domain-containing protein n=1 Tax=Pseudonocardia sp. GCM10023141 TaxID=3252653 RepID=UPI0036112806
MPALPSRPDLEQLRHRAKDLLHAARAGDRAARSRIDAVADRVALATAQLAIAREHGFPSWVQLRAEVDRRRILDDRDLGRLTAALARDPGSATSPLRNWSDHPHGTAPLSYVAMLRYDTAARIWREVPGTAAMARALLRAGAPVDGAAGDPETPLITAASYGDAGVAQVLIDAGADLAAVAAPTAGGIPGATALEHAAIFGMTAVVDVLVGAGAEVGSLAIAAAAGDLTGWELGTESEQDRIRALVMAADHERLDVIDELVAAGTPIDGVDRIWGRQPLWTAAENGRPAGVAHLLAHHADPNLRDPEHRTALDRCRAGRATQQDGSHHDRVEALLAPGTRGGPASGPR